jgi:hypothetical protein
LLLGLVWLLFDAELVVAFFEVGERAIKLDCADCAGELVGVIVVGYGFAGGVIQEDSKGGLFRVVALAEPALIRLCARPRVFLQKVKPNNNTITEVGNAHRIALKSFGR